MKDTVWIINSLLLGAGLAMDAFAVSLANGLHEPGMSRGKHLLIAGTFGFFQTMMPLLGWVFVRTLLDLFTALSRFIPWIAFALLFFIGGKMILEGLGRKEGESAPPAVSFGGLLLQGVATSIDALSVGFTISEYQAVKALASSLIIGCVTFLICFAGIAVGRKAGTKLAGKASIFGGAILILIGIEILLTH